MKILYYLFFIFIITYIILAQQPIPDVITPLYNGVLIDSYLSGEVEIRRDENGVPHIIAQTEKDLYFAQGFVQYCDRIWQFELFNRIVNGKLSEILGPDGESTDVMTVTLQIKEMAVRNWNEFQTHDPITASYITSFVKGIRAFQLKYPIQIASIPEFGAIGLTSPSIWSESDVAAFFLFTSWRLSGIAFRSELLRALRVLENFDTISRVNKMSPTTYDLTTFTLNELGISKTPEELEIIKQQWENENCAYNPFAQTSTRKLNEKIKIPIHKLSKEQATKIKQFLNGEYNSKKSEILSNLFTKKAASNGFVISGEHTDSGKPILAGDPHLGFTAPNSIYELSLSIPSKGIYVSGASMPTTPGILYGKNEAISFAVTNTLADVIDLKIMHHPTPNPNVYYHDGNLHEYEISNKTIYVAGVGPKVIIIKRSLYGPIINQIIGLDESIPICVSWYPIKSGIVDRSIGTLFKMHMIKNFNDFKENFRDHVTPNLNILYADKENNIAQISIGMFPKRRIGNTGKFPTLGVSSSCDWDGYIPFEERPCILNPQKGWIANGNNRVMPLGWTYHFGSEHVYGYRYKKMKKEIESLISKGIKIKVNDIKKIQLNIESEVFEDFKIYIDQIKPFITDPEIEQWRKRVYNWNGKVECGSEKATVFEIWRKSLYLITVPEPNPIFKKRFGRKKFIMDILSNNNDPYCGTDGCIKKAADIFVNIINSFRNQENEIVIPKWGEEIHEVGFPHTPFDYTVLKPYASRYYFVNGGSSTIKVGGFDSPEGKQSAGSVLRYIVQMGDIKTPSSNINKFFQKDIIMMALGNSGHPSSPFYDNFSQSWLNKGYTKMKVINYNTSYLYIMNNI